MAEIKLRAEEFIPSVIGMETGAEAITDPQFTVEASCQLNGINELKNLAIAGNDTRTTLQELLMKDAQSLKAVALTIENKDTGLAKAFQEAASLSFKS